MHFLSRYLSLLVLSFPEYYPTVVKWRHALYMRREITDRNTKRLYSDVLFAPLKSLAHADV